MKQRRDLAGIGDAELYQRKDSQLRSKDIIALRHYRRAIYQKFVELSDEIRIEIDEGLVEHLVEFVDVFIDRRHGLDLIDQLLGIALSYVLQDMVLVLTGSVDVLRKDAEEECDILLLYLVGFLDLRIQRGKLAVYSHEFMIPVVDLDI